MIRKPWMLIIVKYNNCYIIYLFVDENYETKCCVLIATNIYHVQSKL